MYIEKDLYKKITSLIPISCVDVIVRNEKQEYLLIKRNQEPFKGLYWVIGGRINIGEKAKDAAIRKVFEEVSMDLSSKKIAYLGFYEGFFDDCHHLGETNEDTIHGYHTISLIYSVMVSSKSDIELDINHTDWKWSKELPNKLIIQ